ncbi:VanZ family protein [Thiohalorhabdus sp. Cl-TMA]|uniref:VanZ family protein n=1 Tax=Thiohalorhabdus methylotrophus TaxID=3242694 RepID=A0ABV4TVZ1_9GAMM
MDRALRPRTATVLWISAWLLWAALITISSHFPGTLLPVYPFQGADKALHTGVYFVLGVLGVGAAARMRPRWPRPTWGSMGLLAGALFGGLDEYHQSFVAGRRMSMEDWVADLLGLAIAVIVARAARGALARVWLGLERP